MVGVGSLKFNRHFLKSRLFYCICAAQFLLAVYFLSSTFRDPTSSSTFVPSSFDWSKLQRHHEPTFPPTSFLADHPVRHRQIQHDFTPSRFNVTTQNERRDAVKAVFKRSWNSYKQYAWMSDELTPVTAGSQNRLGGWAATLVDALDALWIMDMIDEFKEAAEAVARLDLANSDAEYCNVFEVTIRHLGGLLSAYELSHDTNLLKKAKEFGEMLYVGFDTPTGIPPFELYFDQARNGTLLADEEVSSANPTSLTMEFTRLSQLTGDPKYAAAVARIVGLLHEAQFHTKLPGMWPMAFNMRALVMTKGDSFTIGANADSLYEYLLKMQLLHSGQESRYEEMYRSAAIAIKDNLLFRPMTPNDDDVLLAGTARVNGKVTLEPKAEHLSCFAGGMFAMGGKILNLPEHVEIGAKLTKGCIWAYSAFPHGIMPEVSHMVACDDQVHCSWDEEKWKAATFANHAHPDNMPAGITASPVVYYILRPEALESVFILYRITGEEYYRDVAWTMFQAIEKVTATIYGNAAVHNVVDKTTPLQKDEMQSFWLSETLKYLYLIFSPPDLISLDDYVLNTEAHPFRIPQV